jgi:hypothetical protein
MATPPSSNPIQVTATPVTVIRIKDNVARVKIGAKYWDVRILEKKAGTNESTVLSMSDELAGAIEGIFQSLARAGTIDPKTHKKIILEGERKANTEGNVESVTIKKVKVQKEAPDLEEVLNINEAAKTALRTLGDTLKSHDLALHTHTSEERDASSPTTSSSDRPADAATSTTPSPSRAQTAPTYNYNPLQSEFSTRGAQEIRDPFLEAERIANSNAQILRNSMAEYVADTGRKGWLGIGKSPGNGYDGGEKFTNICAILQKMDVITLEQKARDLGIEFIPGEIGRLLLHPNPTEEQKKNLVKIFAACLKDQNLNSRLVSEEFYSLLVGYLKDSRKAYIQVTILNKDASGTVSQHKTIPQNGPSSPQFTIFLFKDENSLKLFNRVQQGLTDLDRLQSLNSTTEDTTIECGGAGRCADLSLADQIIRATEQSTTSNFKQQIREKVAAKIRTPAFYNDQQNIEAIKIALEAHVETKTQSLKGKIAALISQIETDNNQLNDDIFNAIGRLDENVRNRLYGLIHQQCKTILNAESDASAPNFGDLCFRFALQEGDENLQFCEGRVVNKKIAKQAIIDSLKELAPLNHPDHDQFNQMAIGTEEDKRRLATAFADVIEHEPGSNFDDICFKAFAESDIQISGIAQRFAVTICQNSRNPSADKPFDKRTTYGDVSAPPGKHLYLWYNGLDHYRSVKRDGEFFKSLTRP